MPAGNQKSRSKRRVFVKVPGGATKLTYKARKPSQAKCSSCGQKLVGVPRGKPAQIAKMPKTQRRPQRPFGGNLCSRCSRKKIVQENR
ncbi:50S ribosomal protein L34e [Candidatus Woesearchaeota archaeon]|nr:50S ribosomal protein L34e [Candidatus Woesearchaeota archaeon]